MDNSQFMKMEAIVWLTHIYGLTMPVQLDVLASHRNMITNVYDPSAPVACSCNIELFIYVFVHTV